MHVPFLTDFWVNNKDFKTSMQKYNYRNKYINDIRYIMVIDYLRKFRIKKSTNNFLEYTDFSRNV